MLYSWTGLLRDELMGQGLAIANTTEDLANPLQYRLHVGKIVNEIHLFIT